MKLRLKLLLILLVMMFILALQVELQIFFHIPMYPLELRKTALVTQCEQRQNLRPKTILLWSPLSGSYKNWVWTFETPSEINVANSTCDLRCHVTDDRNLLGKADVVYVSLVDINRFPSTWMPPVSAKQRQNQVWILHWYESGMTIGGSTTFNSNSSLGTLDGKFNWTMSYRSDAFVHFSYSSGCQFAPIIGERKHSISMAGKTKLIAWMVSHCQTFSHREDFVDQLREQIEVDVFGECGSKRIERESEEDLLQNYLFYLSFENSRCEEYITEKVYKILRMTKNAPVPVVMGASKAFYSSVLPPNSFIHVDDFQSPTELAQFLLELAHIPRKYLDYHMWRDNFELKCDLNSGQSICRRLFQADFNRETSVIHNFPDFFHAKPCQDTEYQSAFLEK